MEIQPASLTQIRMGRDGRRHLIADDLLDIANGLRQISPTLRLYYNEHGRYFSVAEICADGVERLVTTANEADQRLLERVRSLQSKQYALELDKQDKEAERAKDHAFSERTGEIAERLAHAVRKDLGHKGKTVVPKELGL